ncbi:MAG: 50S ribosomal protein L15 [Candidatus Aminicenantes bacterium]|jgi:large subunit ribosomal protein L15|nr:MAG: 50S ribosomal protein L15 [Candidatus Aminicenantes bacterium]
MNLSSLHPAKGSKKTRKRIGRGPGSGYGKTAGRGTKGQKSISGYSRKRGFEGGQMPLHRRLPKRGFTNIFKKEYSEINLDKLGQIRKQEIKLKDLKAAGIIKKESEIIKVLGRGDISSSKTIHAHKFSRSALKKIEKAGGKAILIGSE